MWVFDSDDVVLDSSRLKREAFRRVWQSLNCCATVAEAEMAFFTHPGPRTAKIEYLSQLYVDFDTDEFAYKLNSEVKHVMRNVQFDRSIATLRDMSEETWAIATLGDTNETRRIYSDLGLDHYFRGGIFGSPLTKIEVVERLRGPCAKPLKEWVFLGDSWTDFEVALHFRMKFIYVYGFSGFDPKIKAAAWVSAKSLGDIGEHFT